MSQRTSKKHKKKFEIHVQKMETERAPEEIKATNGSHSHDGKNGDDSGLRGFAAEECQKSTNNSPVIDKIQTENVVEKPEIIITSNEENNVTESEVAVTNTATNEVSEVAKQNESHESENQDIEPLVLDLEEVDPELQFDEGSDIESLKGSPFVRCKTRRSQFRNIPTPKTPKSIHEQNGDDKEDPTEKPDPPVILTTTTSEAPEQDLEDVTTQNSSEAGSTSSKDVESDSLTNLSTRAVAGDEITTKDLDLTVNDAPQRLNVSEPLSNPYKEKTLAETLRGISARRTLRPGNDYRKYALKSNMEKANLNVDRSSLSGAQRSSVERVAGVKRKNENLSPERKDKKSKPDSPGILSYITSPIGHLKNRLYKSEVSSSTPKLTSYKTQSDIFENADVSKIDVAEEAQEDVKKEDSNKWCSIM